MVSIPEPFASTLGGRLKRPFLGAFITSWLVIHWRALYVTFVLNEPPEHIPHAEMCTPDKLSYLDTLGYGPWQDYGIPLLIAFAAPWLFRSLDNLVRSSVEQSDHFWDGKREKWFELKVVPRKELNALKKERDELSEAAETAKRQLKEALAHHTTQEAELDQIKNLLHVSQRDANYQEGQANERQKQVDTLEKERDELLTAAGSNAERIQQLEGLLASKEVFANSVAKEAEGNRERIKDLKREASEARTALNLTQQQLREWEAIRPSVVALHNFTGMRVFEVIKVITETAGVLDRYNMTVPLLDEDDASILKPLISDLRNQLKVLESLPKLDIHPPPPLVDDSRAG